MQLIIEKLRNLVTLSPELKPLQPASLEITVPLVDDEYTENEKDVFDDYIGMVFGIVYTDSKGNESRRRIRLNSITQQECGDVLLKSYCFEREMARSFKLSRVQEIVDLSTGEVINPHQFFDSTFGLGLNSGTPDIYQRIIKETRPILHILIFAARCDGQYHDCEQGIILDYISDRYFGTKYDTDRILQYILSLEPSKSDFINALSGFEKSTDTERRQVLRYLNKIVNSDGVLANKEFDLLMEIKNTLE